MQTNLWAIIRGLLLASIATPTATAQDTAWVAPPERPRLIPQLGHYGDISSVAFSNDGKWLFTASHDNTARLWEVTTGREVRVFLGHTDFVTSLALSADGKWLATGSWDNTARLWEVASGNQVRVFHETFQKKQDTDTERYVGPLIRSVSLSADGKWLATGSAEAARVWDTATGKEVHTFRGHAENWNVDAVAISADGKWLVSGAQKAHVWDLSQGKQAFSVELAPGGTHATAISPDAKHFAAGSGYDVCLYELATGKLLQTFKGHTSLINSVAFSSDGKRIVSGASDSTASLWDIDSGREIRAFKDRGSWVLGVALSIDGKFLVSGSNAKIATLWDVQSGKEIRSFQGFGAEVQRVALSGNGKWLATRNDYDRVAVWDLAAGMPKRTLREEDGFFSCMTFSEDGKLLAGAAGRGVRVWHIADGKIVHNLPHKTPVHALEISRDGKWLATACGDRGIHGVVKVWDMSARLWDLTTGKEIRAFKHDDLVNAVALSVDKKWLITGEYRQGAFLWDVKTGKKVRAIDSYSPLSLSDDGARLAAVSSSSKAGLWEVATGKELRTFRMPLEKATCMVMSRDGKWLVIAGNEGIRGGKAYVWNLEHSKQLHVMEGLYWFNPSVAISSDGKLLFTHHDDTTTRIWNLPTGKELCRLVNFRDGGWAAFDAEGRYDASDNGNTKHLAWALGNDIHPLSNFRDSHYDPGLLAKCLGMTLEAPRKLASNKE